MGNTCSFAGGRCCYERKAPALQFSRFWIGIGNASFSIYLIHILIIRSLYVRWINWGIQGKLQPDLQVFVIMGLVIALGYLFYLLVEKPLLRKLKALTAGWANPGRLRKTGE